MKTVELSGGKAHAIVDDEDYETVKQFRWFISSQRKSRHGVTYYAQVHIGATHATRKCVGMHRMIMGLKTGDRRQVDHVNHNGLDNRKENLRVVTVAENAQNSKKGRGRETLYTSYRGVSWHKPSGTWFARIGDGGTGGSFLGAYRCDLAAALRRDQIARQRNLNGGLYRMNLETQEQRTLACESFISKLWGNVKTQESLEKARETTWEIFESLPEEEREELSLFIAQVMDLPHIWPVDEMGIPTQLREEVRQHLIETIGEERLLAIEAQNRGAKCSDSTSS